MEKEKKARVEGRRTPLLKNKRKAKPHGTQISINHRTRGGAETSTAGWGALTNAIGQERRKGMKIAKKKYKILENPREPTDAPLERNGVQQGGGQLTRCHRACANRWNAGVSALAPTLALHRLPSLA